MIKIDLLPGVITHDIPVTLKLVIIRSFKNELTRSWSNYPIVNFRTFGWLTPVKLIGGHVLLALFWTSTQLGCMSWACIEPYELPNMGS